MDDASVVRGLACALACAGCGRIGFDPGLDAVPDVAPAAGPFGSPIQLAELDALGADDPALTGDELEIMFTSDRAGGVGTCDVWTATRPAATASWSVPVAVAAPLNTVACDAGAALSRDGLVVRLASRPAGTFELVEATRASRTSPWQPPIALTTVSSTMDDNAPTASADELTLMFHSNRTGVQRLYIATRGSTADPWGVPALVGPLTVGTKERSPHLSGDGTAVWFISDEGGTQDIWRASRPDTASPFGAAVLVTELASSDSEDDPWVSDDGHRIYFARYPTTGTPTLWLATR